MTDDAGRRSIGAKRNPASADAIREAAEELLVEAGYAGFSIEAVARRARAGKPTIYRWWPGKAALLLDIYHRQKRVSYPDTGRIEDDIFLFLKGLFAHWRETSAGTLIRSIIAEAQSDAKAAAALEDYDRKRRQQKGEMIARAQQRGEIRAEIDPELAAQLIIAYARARLLADQLDDDDESIRRVVRHLLGGWLT